MRQWFFTDRVEELYRVLKGRQERAARAALAGEPSEEPEVWFAEDLYQPFYGGREFSVRDIDGLELIFWPGLDEAGGPIASVKFEGLWRDTCTGIEALRKRTSTAR